jgi:hypothetical protein
MLKTADHPVFGVVQVEDMPDLKLAPDSTEIAGLVKFWRGKRHGSQGGHGRDK